MLASRLASSLLLSSQVNFSELLSSKSPPSKDKNKDLKSFSSTEKFGNEELIALSLK